MVAVTRLTFRSAAKINLNLAVLGRRPDRYHEIFTTFQAIDLYDTLTFEKTASGGIEIISDCPDFPLGPENLVHQVLRQATEFTAEPINVRVIVDKQIPTAAGLGGGSSNAAATLRAANMLYNLSLSDSQLAKWAGRLGADVPFFLGNAQAEGRGRGDLIRPVSFFAGFWLVLIKPAVDLSAGEVYRAVDFSLTRKGEEATFHGCRDGEEFFSRAARAENALTTPVVGLCPEVGRVLRFLEEQGPVAARVSGSGPCVFGIFRKEPNLREISHASPSASWRFFACRPLAGQAAVGLESQTGECTDRQGVDCGNH